MAGPGRRGDAEGGGGGDPAAFCELRRAKNGRTASLWFPLLLSAVVCNFDTLPPGYYPEIAFAWRGRHSPPRSIAAVFQAAAEMQQEGIGAGTQLDDDERQLVRN